VQSNKNQRQQKGCKQDRPQFADVHGPAESYLASARVARYRVESQDSLGQPSGAGAANGHQDGNGDGEAAVLIQSDQADEKSGRSTWSCKPAPSNHSFFPISSELGAK